MADELLAHYRAEIDRLQTLLRAERADNRRLCVAVAHLKQAAGYGIAAAKDSFRLADEGSVSESDAENLRRRIEGRVKLADDLILPLAADTDSPPPP